MFPPKILGKSPFSSLSSWRHLAVLGLCRLVLAAPLSLPYPPVGFSLIWLYSNFPFLVRSRATLIQGGFISLDYFYKDPLSNKLIFTRTGEVGL